MTEDFLDDLPSEIRRRSKAGKEWSTVTLTREGNSSRIFSVKDIFRECMCSFLRDYFASPRKSAVICKEMQRIRFCHTANFHGDLVVDQSYVSRS